MIKPISPYSPKILWILGEHLSTSARVRVPGSLLVADGMVSRGADRIRRSRTVCFRIRFRQDTRLRRMELETSTLKIRLWTSMSSTSANRTWPRSGMMLAETISAYSATAVAARGRLYLSVARIFAHVTPGQRCGGSSRQGGYRTSGRPGFGVWQGRRSLIFRFNGKTRPGVLEGGNFLTISCSVVVAPPFHAADRRAVRVVLQSRNLNPFGNFG